MNHYAMTDQAIADTLGSRLERLRIDKAISRETLSEEIGISLPTLRQLIKGKGTLLNLVAALRILDGLDELDSFLPAPPFSPMALLKQQKAQRKRVSRQSTPPIPEKPEPANHDDEEETW